MDLFQGMTDDQIALLGCGVAFFLCGGLMVVSHHLRQFTHRDGVSRVRRSADSSVSLRRQEPAAESDRKAA